MKLRLANFITPRRAYENATRRRDYAVKKGLALTSHQDSQHGGMFETSCPACQELKSKQEEANR